MRALILGLLLAAWSTAGCRHVLEIVREGEWATEYSGDEVGLSAPSTSAALTLRSIQGPFSSLEGDIIDSIRERLRSGGSKVESDEVILDLIMEKEFSGDWVNLFIAWPGGFIGLPKSLGFKYHMTYYFTAIYEMPGAWREIVVIECGYRMRQCDPWQGILTIVGAYAFYGVPGILSAPFMIPYRDSLTRAVEERARGDIEDIASYVVKRVYEHLEELSRYP